MPDQPVYQNPKLKSDWPEMGAAFHKVSQEMPEAVSGLKQIRPMNWFERAVLPKNNIGVTYPNSTVVYNKDLMQRTASDPTELLRHEMVHVGQNMNSGGILRSMYDTFFAPTDYMARPAEQEAYETEGRITSSARRGDINLPAEKPSLGGLKKAAPR